MSKQTSLTFLFPWLPPLVIKFVMVNNGIEVQVHKNNQQIKDRRGTTPDTTRDCP